MTLDFDKLEAHAKNTYVTDETVAILLVGSRADGTHHMKSDIDLVIIETNRKTPIYNDKKSYIDLEMDLWFYDFAFILDTLSKKTMNYNDISMQSLILSFLQKYRIVYQRGDELRKLLGMARTWQWDAKVPSILSYDSEIPNNPVLKLIYEENISLINILRKKIIDNQIISHRLKDNKEYLISIQDPIQELFETINEVYVSLVDRVWTEMIDARKAYARNDWSIAIASLRDVLKFLVRSQIQSNEFDLVDPRIWSTIGPDMLPEKLVKALELMYTRYPLLINTEII